MIPGPPFVFGSLLVMCALLVSVFIPENVPIGTDLRHKQIGKFDYFYFLHIFFTFMFYKKIFVQNTLINYWAYHIKLH